MGARRFSPVSVRVGVPQEEWALFEEDMVSESSELHHVYVALRDEDGNMDNAKNSLHIPSVGSMYRRRDALEALARTS